MRVLPSMKRHSWALVGGAGGRGMGRAETRSRNGGGGRTELAHRLPCSGGAKEKNRQKIFNS